MIGVITADIINSREAKTEWLVPLKRELQKLGSSPKEWEIYRGDSFQLIINNPLDALIVAIKLKATIKSLGKLDIRVSIGIGHKSYDAPSVTESNGTAFIHSGEEFELLKKKKQHLTVKSDWAEFDKEMNLYLKLGLIAMNNWTKTSAAIVKLAIEKPNSTQEELGLMIGIKQNAVSNRLKRAYYNEIMEMNYMYETKLKVLL